MDRADLLKAAALGLVAGFLSGLFGVGGGILIVPILVLALQMDQRLAHRTSLTAVLPIAISGLVGFGSSASVDWPVAAALSVGAMLGAVIGTHALKVLPTRVLGLGFATVLLLSALLLAFDSSDASGRSGLDLALWVGLLVIGLLSGTLAGMLGVGGGVVMVPAMISLVGIPAAVAKGTSLAVIIPTSMVATCRNLRNGNTALRVAVVAGLAGVVSSFAASKISVGLDERTSNVLFALLLAVVAVRMVVQLRRSPDVV